MSDREQLLLELKEATDQYADREVMRLRRRAKFLRRLNTRIDDFRRPIEAELVRLVISNIDTLVG